MFKQNATQRVDTKLYHRTLLTVILNGIVQNEIFKYKHCVIFCTQFLCTNTLTSGLNIPLQEIDVRNNEKHILIFDSLSLIVFAKLEHE